MFSSRLIVLLQVAVHLAIAASSSNFSVFALTNQGLVKGYANFDENAQTFLGVPFAAPPQRFKPPQPPPLRFSVFDATSFGNPCPQRIDSNWSLYEDCLNLNIYAPLTACIGANLPVLVYWYGGSFIYSSNSVLSNQAQGLASTANVIVVTPNHRLGALGFLYVNELEQADGFKGNQVNFAMLDMIRALTWVKNNIWYFGGDPNKVTIGGHSSGAFLSSFLTVVPQSWNLFNNVLQEEGPLTALDQAIVYPKVVANDLGHKFASAVGCNQVDPNEFMNCLTTKDLLTLVQAWQNFVLLPVVDGDLFPVAPEIAITNKSLGYVKPAPTFMLAVRDPGTIFIPKFLPQIFQVGWPNFVSFVYGQLAQSFLALYSDSIYGNITADSIIARAGNIVGDAVWNCPLRRHATLLTAFTPSVYVTVWNFRPSFFSFPEIAGIVHGATVPFVFGNPVDLRTQTKQKFSAEEKIVAEKIMKAVGRFMRTGNPGPDFPAWQPELHSIVNLNNITSANPLELIRIPPAGPLPPFPGTNRCEFFDYVFGQTLAGKINGAALAEQVALRANFWDQN